MDSIYRFTQILTKYISLEEVVVKTCGQEFIKLTNPYYLKAWPLGSTSTSFTIYIDQNHNPTEYNIVVTQFSKSKIAAKIDLIGQYFTILAYNKLVPLEPSVDLGTNGARV